ncbi:hypothetical protein HYH02_006222 [Chlamydomonas schloesseri]|uniref:HTH HARE-type domain-containing protein n=1 Tax=Chlamydomonas schloesseri TaxID=2026947 RepID=A0A835WJM0_9CHLO|nr:hypothetical protein HYH02_006222 [Chlamydomonas schloesseri]|eukprot:KAG2448873.1 hypothetical protein HYH02_006222 [Chlamydomonas schloesseri]
MSEDRAKRGLRSRPSDRSEDDKAPRASGGAAGGGGIFKSAAVAVLRQHRKLMTTGDITRLAVEMGLLKCQGKTPEATMASALYTDVKRKLQKSLFTRPQEGLFGLREWLDEGYYPEGWVGPPDGLGLAPFKRRNSASAHAGGSGGSSPSKASRTGVRTGPGRSSKARASRSWRNAGSDAEDDDIILDDDDDSPVARPRRGGGISPAGEAAGGSGTALAGLDDEDGDEGLGEGEDLDGEDGMEVDGALEGAAGEVGVAADGSRHESPEPGPTGDRRPSGGGAEQAEPQAQVQAAAGPAGQAAKEEEEEERHGGADAAGGLASARPQPSPSPGPGAGRRGGARSRSGGGGIVGDGGLAQDECLSPLHMLGEAAMSESQGDMPRAGGMSVDQPPSKRKRPTSIAVPERGGGLGGVEGITPKSPYEDSLAALHEIATSPSTFELTSVREQRDATSGLGSGGKGGRARPRLHVDVPGTGDLVGGLNSRRDGTPGASLLTDNLMLHGETTPAILVQASPVTTADGQQAMVYRQAPVMVTLPPALASPSAAGMGQLDSQPLVHVQLPNHIPAELMHMLTPGGHQQLTPGRQPSLTGLGGGAGPRGGVLKVEGPTSSRAPGRRVSFSGQVGILGPPSAGPPMLQPLQPLQPPSLTLPSQPPPSTSGASGGQQVWPPRLTPAQVESELVEIKRVQTVVERLESKLGNTHPQVGKAWLALARMYQHVAEAERNNGVNCASSMTKATEALRRAWAVCRGCAESCGASIGCDEAFEYLTSSCSNAAAAAAASQVDGALPRTGTPPPTGDGAGVLGNEGISPVVEKSAGVTAAGVPSTTGAPEGEGAGAMTVQG